MKPTEGSKDDQVKVVVRVRPPLNRELREGDLFMSTVEVEHKTKLKLYEYHNYEGVTSENF
jgi:hypothetical protein